MENFWKELLKPQGKYSTRRLIALVSAALILSLVIGYMIAPEYYTKITTIITVLSGVAGVSTASSALKKYDH